MGERTDLKRIRELHGMTIKQFAKELGVTRQYIYKVESGERAPSHALMLRWIKLLGPELTSAAFFDETKDAA